MKKDNYILELLALSFDQDLAKEEQQQLDEAFAKHPELEKEKAELLALRTSLASQKIRPNADFVNSVLEKTRATKSVQKNGFENTITNLFPRVAAACVIVLLASLLSIYFQEGGLNTETLLGLTEISPEEAYSFLEE